MSVPIRRGGVYWVDDRVVGLPPTETDKRNFHPRRPFLVVSNDDRNCEDDWPMVLGYPISTADHFRSEFDVPLPKGAANLPDRCHVQVALAQPIAKTKVLDRLGQVDANTMELVVARFISYVVPD